MTIGIIGIVDQNTAIWPGFDFASSSGWQEAFEGSADIVKLHLCRTTGSRRGKRHRDAVGAWNVELNALLLSIVMKSEAVSSQCVACDIAAAYLGPFTETVEKYACMSLRSHISNVGIIVVEDGDALRGKHLYQFAFSYNYTFL